MAVVIALAMVIGCAFSAYAEEPAANEPALEQSAAAETEGTAVPSVEEEPAAETQEEAEEAADTAPEAEETEAEETESESDDALPGDSVTDEAADEPEETGEPAQQEETVPGEEAAPAEEKTPAEEETPAEDAADPTEEAAPTEENSLAEPEKAPEDDAQSELEEAEPKEEETSVPAANGGDDSGPAFHGGFTDSTKTVYEITMIGVTPKAGEYYQIKAWSNTGGEDDKQYVVMETSESSSTYSAQLKISDFKDPGEFTAEVYKKPGKTVLLGTLNFTVPSAKKGTLTVSSLNKTKGTAVVTTKGFSSASGYKKVYAKAWNKSDKSDLYTYNLTQNSGGQWTFTLNTSKHAGVKGKYKIQVYTVDGNGFEQLSASDTVDFSGTTGKITIGTNSTNGKYSVKVANFSSSEKVTGLKAAVWSEVKDQDDLSWITLDAIDETTYMCKSYIRDFKNFGTVNVHVYMVMADGTEKILGTKTFNLKSPSVKTVAVKTNASNGNFAITASSFTSDFEIESVRAEVWPKADSAKKKEYALTRSGSKFVLTGSNIADMGGYSGIYQVRLYARLKNGPEKMVKSTSFEFAESAGSISYADKNAGKTGKEQTVYTLKASGIANKTGVSNVQFRIWRASDPGVKKWYKTTADGKGGYTADVSISTFKKGGQYIAQLYVTDSSGARKSVKKKYVMKVDETAAGTVGIVKKNTKEGRFLVALQSPSAPSGVKSVQFTLWTKTDKADSFTYTAKKQSDGSFRAAADIRNHQYRIGTFHISTTLVMGNGITCTLPEAKDYYKTVANFTFVDKPGKGTRNLGIVNPSGDNVQFAVWSDKNDQDDLIWFKATKLGKTWVASVDLTQFSDAGTYHAHAYSGKETFLAALSFDVEEGEAGRTGWFYENGLKYYYKNNIKQTDLTGMVGGPFQICVNRACNTITVYALDGGNGYIIPVIAFVCSTGLPGMETPTGVYYTYAKNRWEELMGPTWGQYSARVVDGIYIHSMPSNIPYSHYGIPWSEYNKLGSPASHGCIRVNVAAAKWIYDHCGVGTEVKIYDSGDPGPFGKPTAPKLSPGQDWDPTDPEM